jgi:phosphate-selective porin OprO/OprP
MNRGFAAVLLAGASTLALTGTASAAGGDAATKAEIRALEHEVHALAAEVETLKHGGGAARTAPARAAAPDQAASSEDLSVQDVEAQVQDLKRSTSDQYADIQNQQQNAVKVSIDNGRPTIASADGNFTASIRALGQLDWGGYSQSKSASSLPAAYGPNLSNGTNFRRVYLGIQGKIFGDWSYNFNYDFGGSGGTETPGHIQSVYLEYDGLAPFAVRAGAYPPPASFEDATSAGDTIFLERNAPSDLQRNIAGGDGRDAVSLLYAGDQLYGALSYTGGKVQDTPVFGEQQALLGRAAYLVYSDDDTKLALGGNGTYVFQLPNAVARGTAIAATTPGATVLNAITLSDPPELTVDSQGLKLANTTAVPAKHVSQWGLEAAGAWQNFYGQGGYYSYEIDRAPTAYKVFSSATTSATQIVTPQDDSFSGYYLQGTWIITGEHRTYNPATGAFTPPKPAQPFALDGSGWGAFELAGRYSDLDLNDHALSTPNVVTAWTGATTKTYTFYDTVRGGDQRIFTGALNWYPINNLKLAFQYQYIQVSRLQSGTTPSTQIVVGPTTGAAVLPTLNAGQNIQTIAIRAQLSL